MITETFFLVRKGQTLFGWVTYRCLNAVNKPPAKWQKSRKYNEKLSKMLTMEQN